MRHLIVFVDGKHTPENVRITSETLGKKNIFCLQIIFENKIVLHSMVQIFVVVVVLVIINNPQPAILGVC